MNKKIASGSIFRKTYKSRSGETVKSEGWFVKYYVKGKSHTVSAKTTNYDEAVLFLRNRLAESSTYPEHHDMIDRVRMGHLFELLIESYVAKGNRSLGEAKLRVKKYLHERLGHMLAKDFGSRAIREYVRRRKTEDAAPATINKELALIRRSMRLGAQEDPPLVARVPYFEMLPVDNARSGVLSWEQYRDVIRLLPKHARLATVIAYYTGARRGEILSIRREDVDLKARRILRPASATKNKTARYLPIYGDMVAELEMAMEEKTKCPYLIHYRDERVLEFKHSWETACKAAGAEGALFHDLRRTAVTNMIEAGLSEREAMEISGHKTRSMLDRYHIVSSQRLKNIGERLAAHMAQVTEEAKTKGKTKISEDSALVN